MKIGELARRTGVNASAIRYYEHIGLLPAPPRASGQRKYSGEERNRILLIRYAQDMGFTLDETGVFLHGLRESVPVGPRWKELAAQKIKEINASIARARQMKSLLKYVLKCRCATLQTCVRRLGTKQDLSKVRRKSSKIRHREP